MFKMTDIMSRIVQLQRTWAERYALEMVPDLYFKSCQSDFESIHKALPKRVGKTINILDIGAGLGGIDVLLYNYYESLGIEPHLYVLDKNQIDEKIKYGYSNTPSAYNSLSQTEEFFFANDIPMGNYRLTSSFPEDIQFDLIISLISCGFHYSVSEYISYIKKSIHAKTMLVFDIRKFSGQFDTLHNNFNWVNCLQINAKYKRMACRL